MVERREGTRLGYPPEKRLADSPVVLFTNSTIMGGMEEHVLQVGRGLVQRGIRVGVVCSTRAAIQPLRDALAQAGVAVRPLAETGGSPRRVADRFRDLISAFSDYRGGVLHVHSTGYRGADLVVVAARVARLGAVVRTMHLPPVPPIPVSDRVLTPLRDRLLDRIICVSEQTRAEHVRLLGRDPRKCVVIHNGVDLSQFAPVSASEGARVLQDLGLDPATPLVGTVSRLGEHRKGIAHFVEMAARVAASQPTARFLIVGDGSLRSDLERQASTLGVGDKVVFLGERKDVARLLAAMRVFVNPSLWEAGPYTVLEAAAMLVPVVSTPVGLVPEVIRQDGCEGRMVPIGDSAALTRAVLELLSDEPAARKMAERARARVVEMFSVDRMVDRLVEVYRDVLTVRWTTGRR
jgi:glycosyltransferase involved in cell wall biosynthesis